MQLWCKNSFSPASERDFNPHIKATTIVKYMGRGKKNVKIFTVFGYNVTYFFLSLHEIVYDLVRD